MNKTSKETDFSSIITQVARDDETNRPIPLTNTVVLSGTSPTANGTKSKGQEKSFHLFSCDLFSSFGSQTSFSLRFTLLSPCFQTSEESHLFPTARCRCQSRSKWNPTGTHCNELVRDRSFLFLQLIALNSEINLHFEVPVLKWLFFVFSNQSELPILTKLT